MGGEPKTSFLAWLKGVFRKAEEPACILEEGALSQETVDLMKKTRTMATPLIDRGGNILPVSVAPLRDSNELYAGREDKLVDDCEY